MQHIHDHAKLLPEEFPFDLVRPWKDSVFVHINGH